MEAIERKGLQLVLCCKGINHLPTELVLLHLRSKIAWRAAAGITGRGVEKFGSPLAVWDPFRFWLSRSFEFLQLKAAAAARLTAALRFSENSPAPQNSVGRCVLRRADGFKASARPL